MAPCRCSWNPWSKTNGDRELFIIETVFNTAVLPVITSSIPNTILTLCHFSIIIWKYFAYNKSLKYVHEIHSKKEETNNIEDPLSRRRLTTKDTGRCNDLTDEGRNSKTRYTMSNRCENFWVSIKVVVELHLTHSYCFGWSWVSRINHHMGFFSWFFHPCHTSSANKWSQVACDWYIIK